MVLNKILIKLQFISVSKKPQFKYLSKCFLYRRGTFCCQSMVKVYWAWPTTRRSASWSRTQRPMLSVWRSLRGQRPLTDRAISLPLGCFGKKSLGNITPWLIEKLHKCMVNFTMHSNIEKNWEPYTVANKCMMSVIMI